MMRLIYFGVLAIVLWTGAVLAQNGPLKIEITDGVIEPLTFAVPMFEAKNIEAAAIATKISRLVAKDLTNSGLFREISANRFIAQRTTFAEAVRYPDWRAINTQALVTASVETSSTGRLTVKFRIFDVFSGVQLGRGMQLSGSTQAVRRMAHKVADQVYERITGEGPYFDSKIVFVSESGPKDKRLKRLAIMDFDGENVQFLTGNKNIVLAPRISKDGKKVLYTSFETGFPQIYLLDISTAGRKRLPTSDDGMGFSPRFSPDSKRIVYSLEQGGNSDIYLMDLATARSKRMTSSLAIDTAPSFSPDGRQIVFESDRSGTQQLYLMPVSGGTPKRISFENGRYGTPVWSPRGDLIAFTKQSNGRFNIGVMRDDGSEERLLSGSFLDEGPTWSPNGRVIMFARQTQGPKGAPSLYSVDITGRNLRALNLGAPASDPSWGPVQP
ncbi:MAG: Tol-Pal system beta propeller repeat protein TolB [Planktomarina sp.]|jgi:TolB protein|nr:Tol-Pal system beta propeller repeat protein TolB [Planktomarina sp.]MDT2056562.1 Tol-Pal system beta propeller repeat protein TolB [Planktomarina sp.]MDT2072440.1 Tol-Pal system beta propeller repeat protein TolB [Planktomarina sp.]|tara:strand:- start:76 stop:1398 length:1323 start_codon:yes stop_codon:yes gene_type:complete